MHELSVAQSLVEVTSGHLAKSGWKPGAERVSAVRIRIGPLAGVVAEALNTAFSVATVGTELQGSMLAIEWVDLAIWCPQCNAERVLVDTQQLLCPVCKARAARVVRGSELEVVSVEVVDAAADTGSSSEDPQAK